MCQKKKHTGKGSLCMVGCSECTEDRKLSCQKQRQQIGGKKERANPAITGCCCLRELYTLQAGYKAVLQAGEINQVGQLQKCSSWMRWRQPYRQLPKDIDQGEQIPLINYKNKAQTYNQTYNFKTAAIESKQ